MMRDELVLCGLPAAGAVQISTSLGMVMDSTFLPSSVMSAPVYRDWLCAHAPAGVLLALTCTTAQTAGCEVSGHTDRALRAAYLPHAVVEDSNGKAPNTLCGHFLAQVGPELAVQCPVRMRGRTKRERHLLHFRHRHDVAENAAHEREKLNLA